MTDVCLIVAFRSSHGAPRVVIVTGACLIVAVRSSHGASRALIVTDVCLIVAFRSSHRASRALVVTDACLIVAFRSSHANQTGVAQSNVNWVRSNRDAGEPRARMCRCLCRANPGWFNVKRVLLWVLLLSVGLLAAPTRVNRVLSVNDCQAGVAAPGGTASAISVSL